MNNSLFRKVSIDRVSSPEQLNQYIRVTRPGVWITLAAIILLLAGIIIWSVFGTINSTVHAAVSADNGKILCYIAEEDAATLRSGMKVQIGELSGRLSTLPALPEQIAEDTDPYLMHLGGFSAGDFLYIAEVELPSLSDGFYLAAITGDSVHPIEYITH